jgi:hypothetical protein
MKKKILIILLICLFVFAVPAVAKEKEPVGERINILSGTPTEFPADTPFHIWHGWFEWPPYEAPIGLWDFDLEVDGVYRKEDYIDRFAIPYHGLQPDLFQLYYYNFPEGLPAGEHTFVGRWFVPCMVAVEWGYPPCSIPSELVEDLHIELVVTFYE